jgi:mxaJ protein
MAIASAIAAGACAATGGPPAPPAGSRVLRVCADPNNLPFSNDRLQGFENKIAGLVAADLGARVEYVWWAQRRGFVRNTLAAGRCDAVIGLPTGLKMTATSTPYYRSAYVFVTRAGGHVPVSLDDPWLRRATIGVHLIGDDFSNSPPAHALSARGVIQNVRGYSVYGDYRRPNPPAALVEAVASGDIDAAIAWGPSAGYFAKVSPTPLEISRVSPVGQRPYPFEFDISMAVARSNQALLAELDGVIARERKRLESILHDYGVPLVARSTRAAP